MPLLGFRSTPGLPDVLPFRRPLARRSDASAPAGVASDASNRAPIPLDYIAAFDRVRVAERPKGRTKVIFDELSAIVPKGRRIGIFGRPRTGKTTLLNLLAGVRIPNRGKVVRNGSVSWPVSRPAAIDYTLTVRDACIFLGQIYRLDIGDLLDFVAFTCDIPDAKMSVPIRKLDGILYRKLCISTCLAMDFECYLFDEYLITSSMGFSKQIQAQLMDFLSRKSIIVTTKSPQGVADFCDSAAILKNGRLIFYDDMTQAVVDFLTDSTALAAVAEPVEDEMDREPRGPDLGGELGF